MEQLLLPAMNFRVFPCASESMSKKKFGKKVPSQVDMSEIKRAARLLKQKQGWDPDTFVSEDPRDAMRRLNQAQKNEEVYQKQCDACLQAQQQAGDDTALCPEHLAEAMGF